MMKGLIYTSIVVRQFVPSAQNQDLFVQDFPVKTQVPLLTCAGDYNLANLRHLEC